MTRARTHIRAVGISPLIQPLLEAVLCVVVSLVHRVAATFGMRLFRRNHDWHMAPAAEALPQTKPDIHLKDPTTPTASFSGLSRESLLDPPKGLAISPLETINRDSRDKPENDPGDVEALEAGKARVPGAGRDPDSARSADLTRTSSHPAHSDERRNPGQTVRRVPPCSFKPAHAGQPFLDSGVRRNERCNTSLT